MEGPRAGASLKTHRDRDRERERAVWRYVLVLQIKESKDMFTDMRRKAKDTFDDLEQWVQERRQEVYTLIQAEEDAVMTSLAEVEKWRAALALNAATVENLVLSASGGALLGMLNSLTSRLDDLESQTGTTRKVVVTGLTLKLQNLDRLKTDIASLGRSDFL